MSEISKYIDASAEQVESSGAFSISPTKAREKLANYLLTSASDCLLKLVQAAVLKYAKSIALTISRYGFQMRANGARGPSPQDLEKVSLDLLSDPVYLAVHSLLQSGARVAYERTTDSLQRITLPSPTLEAGPAKEAPGWNVEVTFERGFLSSLVGGLKDRAALHKALHRCRFSPVPITLGGRDIIDPYPDRSTRPFFQMPLGILSVSRNFSLYEYYEEHRETNRDGFRCIPARERHVFNRESHGPSAPGYNRLSLQGAVLYHETLGGWAQLFRRALRIPVHLRGDSQLTIVHAGVALETETLKLCCPGVEILESLGDLKTDLSGFKLVRNQAFDRRVEELNRRTRSGLQKIRESKGLLPDFSSKHSSCHLQKYLDVNLPK